MASERTRILKGPGLSELMWAVFVGNEGRSIPRVHVTFTVEITPTEKREWTAEIEGATRRRGSNKHWEISGYLLDMGFGQPNGAFFRGEYSTSTSKGWLSD